MNKLAVVRDFEYERARADSYVQERYRNPCRAFTDGQEFIVEADHRPKEDFCDFAWNDIHKSVLARALVAEEGGEIVGLAQGRINRGGYS